MSGRKPTGLFGLNIYFAWSKSAVDGTVSIGGVSKDKVRHAVRLQNKYDSSHYITMDSSGSRKSTTTIESPNGITIKTGQTQINPGASTLSIQVEKGNLDIEVMNGDFNVIADNFNVKCPKIKYKNENVVAGNITFDTANSFDVKAPHVKITASKIADISAVNVLRLMGDKTTEIISGICSMQSYSTRTGSPPDLFDNREENKAVPQEPDYSDYKPNNYQSVEQYNALPTGPED
tara:strand:- start:376 stop:1077 length:702 start_codon:yes stop_codon:yes gene_type:complete